MLWQYSAVTMTNPLAPASDVRAMAERPHLGHAGIPGWRRVYHKESTPEKDGGSRKLNSQV